MKEKQPVFPNTLKPAENKTRGKNGSSILSGHSTSDSGNGEVLEYDLILQLQKVQENNIQLEQLVEQQTKKLIEVVATNAKFISIIAHDLRSPFNGILGSLGLLKEKLETYNVKEIEELINIASDSANKTLELLESLLKWAMSQNMEISFNPVKIKLHELIIDEIKSINSLAIQKQLTLNHSIASDLKVCADIQMVKTIVRNLISNAIKYTNPGGEISIEASEIRPFVEISVEDNGIGMTYEDQDKLFKTGKFHSMTGTHNEKGSGLGLLLCKELVEMHGGIIHIESEPGNGTKIKFTLPHYI